ncbi:uncharacterized protein LOC123899783 isoform X2 [Trifolium pratense]|uniref:uncharacterized protein LOC123899783 isoform X2 n=1 Tax=Trifolium pratense TaxID=57577 RepID=UPI001E695E7D|nr:uncharacterized protein LOC123899783 isoform X2 [Trifolium pratense]
MFSQWRKDIKRKHTLIKCGFDNLTGNAEFQRVGKACDAFYEVASTEIKTEEELLKVMDWIKDLKIELTCKKSSPRIREEDGSIPNQVSSILDPVEARRKGRPREKRKAAKVDQIVKKKLAKKKTQTSQKRKNSQSQEEHEHNDLLSSGNGGINSLAPFDSTQEQNGDVYQCEQRYLWRTEYGTVYNLAPFNPNQVQNGELDQPPTL